MSDDPKAPQIRPKALCVFQAADRILVGHGYDSVKREHFYRPLGGAIEFGETALETLRREIREELDTDIAEPRLLGVLENIFTCDGALGHEVLFVFDARFADASLYAEPYLNVLEGGWDRATWEPLAQLAGGERPVYPDGLLELCAANRVTTA